LANISKKDALYILINDATVFHITLLAKLYPFMKKKKKIHIWKFKLPDKEYTVQNSGVGEIFFKKTFIYFFFWQGCIQLIKSNSKGI